VLLLTPLAAATALSLRSTTVVEDGVTLKEYQAFSPTTDVWVLEIDLCTNGVYMDATTVPTDTQTTGSWASDVDATAATNGDFYKTGPVRVYGDAVGGAVRWPSDQTGLDDSGEWYHEHAGWIAFLQDGVEINHTPWVKENRTVTEGWENSALSPAPPAGTLALVSGFPEVVVEGVPMTCADPEASDCFPDRSDMRDRHPRTAMGLTQDRSKFFLVVADGRTSESDGLYGSELADIMGDLGAWTAFNLDGGGSTQMWVDGDYVNNTSGNNSGGSNREVANHWGVFAGGRAWLPDRPGHCASADPCGVIPAAGGVIDDDDACFRTFGPREYWRDESDGYDGGLYWTNAFDSDEGSNVARWQIVLEEAGEYELSVWADTDWNVHDDVNYEVRAAGVTTELQIDPTGVDGWVSLGTFTFAAGDDQWLTMSDDEASSPGSNQHIVADAIQLVRVGGWCGDGACDSGEACVCADCPISEEVANGLDDDCDGEIDEATGGDTAPPDTGGGDSGVPDSGMRDSGGGDDADPAPGRTPGARTFLGDVGCGCRGGSAALGLLPLIWVARRRRSTR
jgi:hypothetical protein